MEGLVPAGQCSCRTAWHWEVGFESSGIISLRIYMGSTIHTITILYKANTV